MKKKAAKSKPPPLTEVGKAIRERDAEFERDYSEAIKTAGSGNATRLVNLLRAHRRPVTANTLTDDDLDRLADFIEATVKRKRGRGRDEAVHAVAEWARVIMHMGKPLTHDKEQPTSRRAPARPRHYVPVQERDYKLDYPDQYFAYPDVKNTPDEKTRTAAINIARREYQRTHGVLVDPARVRDLLNRPKKRHRPK